MALEHLNDDRLQSFLDQSLTETERRLTEEHLAQCADCREQLTQYEALYRGLQDESEFALPESFAATVAEHVQEAERGSIWMSWPVLGGGSVIAAMIAIGYLVGLERLGSFLREIQTAQSWLRSDLLATVSGWFDSLGQQGELILFGVLALVMVAVLDRLVDSLKRGRAMFVM